MKANITGENEERVGLYVDDNNDVEHWIEMEFDGKIRYHEQGGYPDDLSERSHTGNQHVDQARRYARWYVYQQTEYDTLPPAENPERIAGVLLALQALDTDEFEALFGDFYRQIVADVDSSVTPPVAVPQHVRNASTFVYQLGVELEQSVDELRGQTLETLPAVAEQLSDVFGQDGLSGNSLSAIFDAVTTADVSSELTFPDSIGAEFDIDISSTAAVDILYYPHPDSQGERLRGDSPDDPDARLSIEAGPITDTETFRYLLIHHLVCQIRDCYIGMGEQPPEPYRLVGRGLWEFIHKYNSLDFYEPYHKYDADIPDYYRAF